MDRGTRESARREDAPEMEHSPADIHHPDDPERAQSRLEETPGQERTIELREERLRARKELREAGEIQLRKEVDEVPGRLEVEAYREEVEVEHVPIGRVVQERAEPREEGGVLVVPVYEEQLVVSKRLVLREEIHVRRVGTTETQLFTDSLRKERLVVEDPSDTGAIHERYPAGEDVEPEPPTEREEPGGFLGKVVRKALE